jgi:hypothetical protein
VVGAYPPSGEYDECTGSEDHKRALGSIPKSPIMNLPKGVIRIATAGPVTQCHRCRNAGFAGVDHLAELGRGAAEVENIDGKVGAFEHSGG